MSQIAGFMSVFLKNSYSSKKLDVPDVKILHHGRTLISSDWNISYRNMPFWYCYWNETPGAILEFGEKTLELTPEFLLLIPPHTTFSTKLRHSFQHFFIHFTAGGSFTRIKRHEILLPAGKYISSLKRRMEHDSVACAMQLYALLYELLLILPADCFAEENEPVMDPRILKALEFMMRPEALQRGNLDVCKEIGMSLSNFQRLFKLEMETSPKHYFLNLRLEKARQLLLSPDFSVPEIARQTGFADRYHFSKAFKAYFKMSPVQFRIRNIG